MEESRELSGRSDGEANSLCSHEIRTTRVARPRFCIVTLERNADTMSPLENEPCTRSCYGFRIFDDVCFHSMQFGFFNGYRVHEPSTTLITRFKFKIYFNAVYDGPRKVSVSLCHVNGHICFHVRISWRGQD